MCLVSDELLSILTPRLRADAEGQIGLPQKTIDEDWMLFRGWGLPILRNSASESIESKAIGSEPGINLVKGGGKQGETFMRLIGWKWKVTGCVTSAYKWYEIEAFVKIWLRGLLYIEKRRGPRTEPCCIPVKYAGRWNGMWLNRNWLCSIQEIGSN